MQIFNSLEEFSQQVSLDIPLAITLGNFDGVHLGHQRLLKQLTQLAEVVKFQINQSLRERKNLLDQVLPQTSEEVRSLLITFNTPIDSFIKGQDKPTISPIEQKIHLVKKYGNLDYFLNLPVDQELVDLSPEEFIKLLLKHINIKLILVGDDFRFGKNRSGDFEYLLQLGNQLGFKVEQAHSLIINSMRVSSSLIRNLLHQAEFETAATYLGYEYHISGEVIQGQQLARLWNIPTANILMNLRAAPVRGVYICAVIVEGKTYFGASNIGTRPTLKDSSDFIWYCETHIFDFSADIYGKNIKVIPIQKIRDENKFPDLSSLRKRIYDDICIARTWLTHHI